MKELRPYDLNQLPQQANHKPTPYNLNYAHMKKKQKRYKDVIHWFTALSISKTGAWMLIRSKCHELGLTVPTQDQVVECSNNSKP